MTTLSAFLPVIAGGFAVAFFHAATPTHWLPFVLVGRAQGWSSARTVGVAGVAGLGHSLFTALLGLAITGAGHLVEPTLGEAFPRLVGGGLVALGVYYLVRHLLRAQPVPEAEPARRYRSSLAAVAGLVTLVSFTPSDAVLPVYLANVGSGWAGFVLLTAMLSLATVLGMVMFTGLFIAGADRLGLHRLEQYELAIVGAGLCAIGMFVALDG